MIETQGGREGERGEESKTRSSFLVQNRRKKGVGF
jgi:hypothetical protein